MPGDTDISHAVEERLVAIESRLDALEGGGSADEVLEDDSTDDTVEQQPVSSYSTSRSRSKRTSSSDATSLEVPEATE